MKIYLLLPFIIYPIVFVHQAFASLFFTGDLDLRYNNYQEHEFEFRTASISLRKVFADKMGDRLILFLVAETMYNFQETMIDQGYAQYKGPLGKWNLIMGRYRLPFGLLPNYSTKRLLITTLEHETIGFSSDNGLQLSGTIESIDYTVSLSQGIGTATKRINLDDNGLFSFRIGYQGVDFEGLRIGLSGLLGKITLEGHNENNILNKKLFGLDLIKYYGPFVTRGELSFGDENNKTLLGIFCGTDYTLLPNIDLNTGYSHLKAMEYKKDSISIGLTYNVFSGCQIRGAQKISLSGGENEFSLQVYYIYNRSF